MWISANRKVDHGPSQNALSLMNTNLFLRVGSFVSYYGINNNNGMPLISDLQKKNQVEGKNTDMAIFTFLMSKR